MNRNLLAGASALALLAGASAANAQFTVAVTGDHQVDFGYTDITTNVAEDDRNTDFIQRTRVNITATQKTDSGLTYGSRTRLRFGANQAGTGLADVSYDISTIFINGSFGQVVVGNGFGLFSNLIVAADAWGTGGSDGVFGNFVGGRAGAGFPSVKEYTGGDSSNSRVYYVSPSFSGFTAGVSYTPVVGSTTNRNIGRGFEFDKNLATFNDVIEVAARYSETIGGAAVTLVAAYTFGEGRPGTGATNVGETEDLSAYSLLARVGFGPFAVSAHYVNNGQGGLAKNAAFKEDATSWALFAQYTVLPELTLGASYGVVKSAGAAAVQGDNERTVISVGASYTVAPGLTIRPEYVNYDYDTSEAGALGDSGNIFIFRTQVNF
jgi:outer membrane protein OmpU